MKGKRNNRRNKDTVTTILAIAEREFADNGFDKTTVRNIARGAGVNVAMIYYYFNTKEDLYKQVLEDGFRRLSVLLKTRVYNDRGPEEKIFEIISTYIFFFHSHKSILKIILREMISGSRHLDTIINKYIAGYFDYYQRIVREGIEKKIFIDVDPGLTILSLMGMIFYFFNYEPIYTRFIEPEKRERLIDYLPQHIHNLFIYGLKRRSI